MHRYLLGSAHHSVRCFVSSLFWSTNVHFSVGFGLSSSLSSESWLHNAELHTPLHCLCSRFRHETFVQHCSFFCQLPSLTNFSHFFLRAVCLDMLHFHRHSSSGQLVQFFPDLTHKSASPAFGLMHVLSPLDSPSTIPLLHFPAVPRREPSVATCPSEPFC